eukprot:6488999-Amphidinium_carterae.2
MGCIVILLRQRAGTEHVMPCVRTMHVAMCKVKDSEISFLIGLVGDRYMRTCRAFLHSMWVSNGGHLQRGSVLTRVLLELWLSTTCGTACMRTCLLYTSDAADDTPC